LTSRVTQVATQEKTQFGRSGVRFCTEVGRHPSVRADDLVVR
jgi:hypothetical protein